MDSPKAIEAWRIDRDGLLQRAVGECQRIDSQPNMTAERREECRRDAMIFAAVADAITNKLKHDVGEYVTTFNGNQS